jgi:2-phospho-L-lactate guanylyltransferase
MRTLAILPVKRFELAKTRLQDALDPDARRALARAMVADVLDALLGSPVLDGVIVVTNARAVAEFAGAAGARLLRDPHESGQSAAALVGIEHAIADGYERVLLVPGDCPALDGAAIEALLRAAPPPPSVTAVADRHGEGTNALLLAPPAVIEPGFGPGSLERHRARAAASGAAWRTVELPGLLLDIDTAEDLAALRAALSSAGPRTRAALEAP